MGDIVMMSLIVSLLYGISPVLYRYISTIHPYEIHAFTLLLISASVFFVCTLMCYVFHSGRVKHDLNNLYKNKNALIMLLLSSILSVFIANLLYFMVLNKSNTKSYIVSALVFTSPLFTLMLSYIFLEEDITYTALFSVGLIVAGILTLTLANV